MFASAPEPDPESTCSVTSRGPPRLRGSPDQIRRANSPVPGPVGSDRATRRPHAASNSDTAGPSTATPLPTVKPASSPVTLRLASRLLARPIGRRPGMRLQHRNQMRGLTGEPCKIRCHIGLQCFSLSGHDNREGSRSTSTSKSRSRSSRSPKSKKDGLLNVVRQEQIDLMNNRTGGVSPCC
jgi:hypothetical protein